MRSRPIPAAIAAPTRHPALAGLLSLLVLVPGAAIAARHGFDGLYGQDAFGYVDYALGPLRDALLGGRPPPPFHWPPGYPLLVVAAATVVGDRLAGLAISLLAGAVLPVLVALLTARLPIAWTSPGERTAAAVVAGASAAVAGHVWQSSVVAMSDTSGAAAAILGAIAVCRHAATGRLRWLALAAAALGAAIGIRWVYGLVAVPLALAAIATLARHGREDPRRAVRHASLAAGVGLLVLAPTAGPMLGAAIAGDPIPFAADFAAYRWSPATIVRSTVETIDGRLQYALPTGAFYLLQPAQPYWLGPLVLLVPLGVLRVLRGLRVRSAAAALVLVGWPLVVLGFLAGGGYQNTRFFLAALAPLAVLAGLGATELHRRGRTAPPGRPARLLAPAAILLVAGGLVVGAGAAWRFTDSFVARQSADLAAIRSLEARVPDGDRLIAFGATTVLAHDRRPNLVELYGLDEARAVELATDGRTTWLLLDRAAIERQWRDHGPGRAVAALEDGPGLEAVATGGTWTLYRVR